MTIQTSKSILAKLLAQEDITVVHATAPTASFDTQNRVLTLPVWKDMTGDLYDLLVGHEVGHAQFTPPEGWHNAVCPDGDIKKADMAFKSFLNVIEDARIEKKIKSRFPGLRANFYRAYAGLHEKDFFEVKNKKIADLLLIDRINLHFKLGSFVAVPFSEEEKVYIRRMEKLETWEEVEALARELYEKAKDDLKAGKRKIKLKLMGAMEDGNVGEAIKPEDLDLEDIEIELEVDDLTEEEQKILAQSEPIAETDTAFREKETELLDENSRTYVHVNLQDIDSRPFVVSYKKVLEEQTAGFQADQKETIPDIVKTFRRKNDKFVNYLVKEFELRRNAQQQARAKISKSGELDMKKLFNYQLSEDLFRRFTTLPNGKNHGLIMYFDMSGSMGNQMHGVIEQMIVLVEFCRKVNIAFEVYGFTNTPPSLEYMDAMSDRDSIHIDDILVYDAGFSMRQYFTDSMRPSEYKTMLGHLLLLAHIYQYRSDWRRDQEKQNSFIPEMERLNGTPLNPALLISIDIHRRFVERTKAEIVNLVVLTDGESDDQLLRRVDSQWRNYSYVPSPQNNNVFLTHTTTRKSVKVDKHDVKHTKGLVKLIGEVTGANMICFDIVENTSRRIIGQKMFKYQNWYDDKLKGKIDTITKKFRKEKIYVIENIGWTEHYLILGGEELDIDEDEIDVESGAGTREILRAFSRSRNNRLQNRVLLNRFVGLIA